MKATALYRLAFLLIILGASVFLYAYNHKEKPATDDCTEGGRKSCCEKKADSEFIILESIVDRLTACR
ncbi:hypothetical protein [Pinibacter soli]|uniref:Membrane or secreted protein n=1 Tax=Pinibacter soli TaxID=3044211 RepID=A0ABT6R820_9BACT|nr:hypothetical protein [Pinibacter soli]MDI3318698.1 hypothetical protein [Pinibacter soli]